MSILSVGNRERKNGFLGIGLGTLSTEYYSRIGTQKDTVGYWDDGSIFHGSWDQISYTDGHTYIPEYTFQDGDVVGLELNTIELNGLTLRYCRFRKNGKSVGPSMLMDTTLDLFPYICFHNSGSHVKPSVTVKGISSI